MGRERMHTYITRTRRKESQVAVWRVYECLFLELSSLLEFLRKILTVKRYSQLMSCDHFTNNDIDY